MRRTLPHDCLPISHVAVPVQVFRRALHREIDAHGERLLVDRSGKRVVDARDDIRGAARRGDRLDVHAAQRRVDGRFEPHQLGLGPDDRRRVRQILERDEAAEDSHARQQRLDQMKGAAVDGRRADDFVAALENGNIRSFEISPEDAGLPRTGPDSLKGGDAQENAASLQAVLDGKPSASRDVALFNAAAALIGAGKVKDITDGVALGQKSLDSVEHPDVSRRCQRHGVPNPPRAVGQRLHGFVVRGPPDIGPEGRTGYQQSGSVRGLVAQPLRRLPPVPGDIHGPALGGHASGDSGKRGPDHGDHRRRDQHCGGSFRRAFPADCCQWLGG